MTRLLALVVLFLLATAVPAAAHDTEDAGPPIASDARSAVVAEDLPPGVTLDVLQNGWALRLRNESPSVVTVRDPALQVPPGGSVQWHLGAAHADEGPHPAVQPWRVTVDVGGATHQVLGEVRWTAGPSPVPWLVGAGILAAGVVLAGWVLRRPGVLAAALAAAIVVSIAHNAAALADRTAEGSRWALLGDYLPQVGCWLLGALAVALLVRSRADGLGLGALTAVGLVLVTLVRDGSVLDSSTVVVALPAVVDRLAVTVSVGLAAGVLAALPLVAANSRATTEPARQPS